MGSLGRVGLRKVAATGGEVNSGVNVGVGVGKIFKDKPALDLRFRSILAGAGITINNLADEIEIVAAGGSGITSINLDIAAAQTLTGQINKILINDVTPDHAFTLGTDVVLIDRANTYGFFDQVFKSSRLLIRNAGDTFNYIIAGGAIGGNRVLTLPAVSTNDIFAVLNLSGQRFTARQIFNNNRFSISNPAQTATYIWNGSAIAVDRVITLPLLLANDIPVFELFIQPLQNKDLTNVNNSFRDWLDADIGASAAILQSKLAALVNANLPIGSAFQRKRTNAGATAIEDFTEEAALVFTIGDGVSVITTGVKMHIRVPFDCEVTRWTLLAKQSGSIVVDVNRFTSLVNFDADTKASITGTDTPDLVSDRGDESTALTGWTTVLNQGDILEVEVDSITTINRVTLVLRVNKRG